MWKGAISFGLVNIPVRLFAATGKKDVKFRHLHEVCRTPIQYRKTCPHCEQEVTSEEIVKGYEYERGRFVVINERELEQLPAHIPGETERSIAILDFIRQEELDPIYYDRSYYLGPGETGEKAFRLLYRAMAEEGMVAIARLVLRSRQALAVIRCYGETLALETMFYPDEIRSLKEMPSWNSQIEIGEQEIKMARELVGQLTTTFDPSKYNNRYRRALLEIIEAKIAGKEVVEAPAAPRAEVVDLVDALKASLAATGDGEGKTRKTGEGKKVGSI